MPNPQTERFWTMPFHELADWCGMNADPDSRVGAVAKVVLEVRATQEATVQMAKITRNLAVATWVLVASTLAVALVTAFSAVNA